MSTVEKNFSYAYGLDVVRFLCSTMVCVFHLTWHNPNMVATVPFGWVSVQIFFVISGVVIAGSATKPTAVQFIKRRFLRLYPVAWIAAVINFGILLCVPRAVYDELGIWVVPTNAALFHSLTLLGTTFLASAYWTLPIEISFYGLVMLILFGGGIERLRQVARLLIAVSVPYLVLLFCSYAGWERMQWVDLGYGPRNMFLLRYGIYFAIGIYFWLLTSRHAVARVDWVLFFMAMCGALLELFVRGAQTIGNYAIGPHGPLTLSPLVTMAAATFFVLTSLIYLSIHNAGKWVPAPRLSGCLRTLGLATYPFYLIHEVTGGFLLNEALEYGFSYKAGIVISITIIVLLACMVALYAEPWLLRILRKSTEILKKPKEV